MKGIFNMDRMSLQLSENQFQADISYFWIAFWKGASIQVFPGIQSKGK